MRALLRCKECDKEECKGCESQKERDSLYFLMLNSHFSGLNNEDKKVLLEKILQEEGLEPL